MVFLFNLYSSYSAIYFSAVLSLLLWKHERWATSKLELHPTQRGHTETSEPPQANRHDVISKPFLPPNICPSAGGKAAEQRRYCSVQPHSWHRSPTAAWKSWQGMPEPGPLEQLHGARSQRLPSCCWKGLQVTLSPTGPLWFHKPLTHTVKTGVILKRLLPIHKFFY